jgi:hypothetical protein
MKAKTPTPSHSKPSAKNTEGDFDRFTDFMRRLVAVPHSEIKAKLDAEKRAKKRTPKPSTSRHVELSRGRDDFALDVSKSVPQRLKPSSAQTIDGPTEVVP